MALGRVYHRIAISLATSLMLTTVALTYCLLVANASNPACYQPVAEQNKIQDESNEFTVHQVEFVGLTYTRDQTLRNRMTLIEFAPPRQLKRSGALIYGY